MKKSLLVPLGTVLLGILCFFLRKHQVAKVKDMETLLYTPFAQETILLYVVVAVSVGVLGFFLFTGSRSLPNYEYMVYCPSLLFPLVVGFASLLLVISFFVGVLDLRFQEGFFQSRTIQQGVMEILRLLSIPLAAVAGLIMAKAAYLGETLETNYPILFLACPPVFLVLNTYQTYSHQPNLEDRIWPIFSGLALMYSCYLLAAATVKRPQENLFCFSAMVSMVFFSLSMGGDTSLYLFFVGLGYNLLLSAFAVATMENAFCSLEVYRVPPSGKNIEESLGQ